MTKSIAAALLLALAAPASALPPAIAATTDPPQPAYHLPLPARNHQLILNYCRACEER